MLCANYFPEYSVKEDERVEGTEYQNGSHNPLGTICSREFYPRLVDLVGNIHEERQQRVAIYIVFCVPVRYNAVGKWVETCHMEGFDEKLMIAVCDL